MIYSRASDVLFFYVDVEKTSRRYCDESAGRTDQTDLNAPAPRSVYSSKIPNNLCRRLAEYRCHDDHNIHSQPTTD